MAYLDPTEAFEQLKKNTTLAVKSYFPLKGKKHTLEVDGVEIPDTKDVEDIHSQKEAKEKGRSWTVPIRANLRLIDNETGKVLDKQEVTVGQLPKVTRRHSYIVDGNEWQVNNQFRLKSGVFTRIKNNGELASQWNVARGPGFEMNFAPDTRKLNIRVGGSSIPLYPVLKTLGVDDDAIQGAWGKEILSANKTGRGRQTSEAYMDQTVHKAYKALTGKKANTSKEALEGVRSVFERTILRPDSTKVTLGEPFDTVNGPALLAGSKKILRVSRQEEPPDNRDSLVFKDFLAVEDLLQERIAKDARWDIERKLNLKVDKVRKVKEVVSPETFGRPIKAFFTSSTISDRPDQMNPVQFLVGARRTTLGGEHGISGAYQTPDTARTIDPSSVGFLDPIHTPENPRIGTVLQMGIAAKKVGKEIKTRVFNPKTGRTEYISPSEALQSNLAFGDQYKWDGGKPSPLSSYVKVTDREGGFNSVKPTDVDYIIRSPKGMFDISTNMIPFLQNNQGNRTSVASRQLEQAVPLVNREAPLVQVRGETAATWENAVGKLNSHVSRVDGTVTRVGKDTIYIKDGDNKTHKIPLYDDFPLNDNKSVLNSTPLVKAGDSVKAGQVVADSNFSKDGVLAIGTNLRTAYMPYHGYNFDDGVVISESAAQKLKSEHMLRENIKADKNTTLDKGTFFAHTAGQFSKEQADKLDDNGVIKPGSTVEKGDVLVGAVKKVQWRPEHNLLAKFSKKLVPSVEPTPITWDKPYSGVVSKVVQHGKETTVYVKTQTPAEVGDKLAGRHGNKGIITRIVPDHEMPRTSDGVHAELLLNPAGVPGRINLGQVLETAAAKIARKTGKPYVVNNFDSSVPNYTKKVQADLAKHGISDTEVMYDPKDGRPLKSDPVLFGEQFMLKLHHTAEGGIKARSRAAYDINAQPKKGPTGKAQSLDAAGLNALLAHGARANIRELQTIKADRNDEYWNALQAGESLPAPKIPFAYEKFKGYLKGMGVNIEKDGSRLSLVPMTDKQVVAMSSGRLTNPDLGFRAKDAKPEKGSIFDEEITGTQVRDNVLAMGKNWSHFTLSERMPNPVFEAPIKSLLGISTKQFEGVIAGKDSLQGKTGPSAISDALTDLNVKKELDQVNSQIPNAARSNLSKLRKKARYLSALQEADLSPKDAYTMKHVPVLPPVMRPVSILPNGNLNTDDLNDLYRGIAQTDNRLRDPTTSAAPDDIEGGANDLRAEIYDGLRALTLVGTGKDKRHKKGIMEMLAGSGSPKQGFFQSKMIGKRQDLSMRGVIVPETKLGVDEIGIPEESAKEIYKPFIQRRLVQWGSTPGQAAAAVREGSPRAIDALDAELRERPLLVKRDPVLHKYGVQAFLARRIRGSAMQLHPLATSGYNADFDGDKMSAYVPVTQEAVREAHNMLPSKNLFSPSTGQLMYKPTQESLMGLHDISKFGRKTSHRFRNVDEAARAVQKGEIRYTDVIRVDDPTIKSKHTTTRGSTRLTKGLEYQMDKVSAASVDTTIGRLLIQSTLPESMRSPAVLTDKNFLLDESTINKMLSAVARTKTQKEFATSADKLKDIGYLHATGFSFGLNDLLVDNKHRDEVFAQAKREDQRIRATTKNREERDQKLVNLYGNVGKKVLPAAKQKLDQSDNRLYDWVRSGAKGKWSQFHQMAVAPVQVVDTRGNPMPVPIEKSYAEGLDSGSYYAAMYGARMGTIGRVKGTADPGALSKQLMQTSLGTLITNEDCGTTRGQHHNVMDPYALDRYTTRDIQLGNRGGKDKGTIPAGTLVTPAVMSRLRNNKVSDITVRTPLKCAEPTGICAKCFGLNEDGRLHNKGVNIGVIATQALGEPLTQMAMNSFHCNHADSLVFVAPGRGRRHIAVTMEDLFNMVESESYWDGDEEIKDLDPEDGWLIYDGLAEEGHQNWVQLTHVRRHVPDRPMRIVGDGGLVTICQDNHPIAVWQNPVSCVDCGYHRLKAPSPASRAKNPACARCGLRQPEQSRDLADSPGFLSPAEIEPKKFYLQRDFIPANGYEDQIDPVPVPGWIAGMFLAEGSVIFRRSWKKAKTKKPYSVCFTQNEGGTQKRLERDILNWGHIPKVNKKSVIIHSVSLGMQFHGWFGRYSHSKALPPDFISYPRDWMLDCVAGIIDGDGTIERHKNGPTSVGVDTTSFALAQQLVFMAGSLNLHASITPTTNRDLTRNQGYKVRIRLDGSVYSSLLLKRSTRFNGLSDAPSSNAGCSRQGHRLVSLNREILYTKKYVYDATTSTGTLVVSGLRSHNTGGVSGARGSTAQSEFQRVEELVKFQRLPKAAVLSHATGKVDSIKQDKVTGGFHVKVGDQDHFVPALKGKPLVSVGQEVKKGDSLSPGPKDPRELLPLTGIGNVQRYVTDELSNLYRGQSTIHRRNAEVVVRNLTNLAQVEDPGSVGGILRGDRMSTSEIEAKNRKLKTGEQPIKYRPLLKSVDLLPTEVQEDWMARLQARYLKRTLLDAAAEGWASELHGTHPIPGMAYGKEFGTGTPEKPYVY